MSDKIKSSIQKDSEGYHILVETEIINFSALKKEKILYYIVEIHSTESSDVGIIAEEIDGIQHPIKYDSFSKAKYSAGKLEEQLGKDTHWFTKIISKEEDIVSSEEQ